MFAGIFRCVFPRGAVTLPARKAIVHGPRAPAPPETSRLCWHVNVLLACLFVAVAQPADGQVNTKALVAANAGWVDTGIDVRSGDRLTLGAAGEWTNGGDSPRYTGPTGFGNYHIPNTEVPDAPLAAVVGRIGHASFLVGKGVVAPAPASGRLFLGMNDVPGTYADNRGDMQVVIHVDAMSPSPPPPEESHPPPMAADTPEGIEVLDKKFSVPDVVGRTPGLGVRLIEENQLRPEFVGDEPGPANLRTITRTDPPAGTFLVRGSEVRFWLASGRNKIPDLRGRTLEETRSLLRDAGFYMGVPDHRRSDMPNGLVDRQYPNAGTMAAVNSRVTPIVSTGPVTSIDEHESDSNDERRRQRAAGVMLSLALGAVAATKVWRRRRLEFTRRALSMRPSLDTGGSANFRTALPREGPDTHLLAYLEAGEVVFPGAIPIERVEIGHD